MFKRRKEKGLSEGDVVVRKEPINLIKWRNNYDRCNDDLDCYSEFLCVRRLGSLIYLLPLKTNYKEEEGTTFMSWLPHWLSIGRTKNRQIRNIPPVYLTKLENFKRSDTDFEGFITRSNIYDLNTDGSREKILSRLNVSYDNLIDKQKLRLWRSS